MPAPPISAYQETSGMLYFARMLDKIRKHARGELREDFIENLCKGFDARCTHFLRVGYDDLKARTLAGGTDEEILQWCFAEGRELSPDDLFIWNNYLRKVGWRDQSSEILERRKRESGLEDRTEIETMLEFFEYDEGRKG